MYTNAKAEFLIHWFESGSVGMGPNRVIAFPQVLRILRKKKRVIMGQCKIIDRLGQRSKRVKGKRRSWRFLPIFTYTDEGLF